MLVGDHVGKMFWFRLTWRTTIGHVERNLVLLKPTRSLSDSTRRPIDDKALRPLNAIASASDADSCARACPDLKLSNDVDVRSLDWVAEGGTCNGDLCRLAFCRDDRGERERDANGNQASECSFHHPLPACSLLGRLHPTARNMRTRDQFPA